MKLESIITICNNLNSAGVRYIVAGGLAVIAHGYTRLTMDMDMIVAFERDNMRAALDVLAGLGYRPQLPVDMAEFSDEACREQWSREKNMVVFSLIHSNSGFPVVDLFVREPFDFDEEYQRVEALQIAPETDMPVVSLPTLIRMKEQTGRPKDALDVSWLKTILSGNDDEKN